MIDYEVGSIPTRPLTIAVRDEQDNPINTVGYTDIRVEMTDGNNKEVDTSQVALIEVPDTIGVYNLIWPRYSMFDEKGIYTLRLVMGTQDGRRDITRTAEIRVREYGRMR